MREKGNRLPFWLQIVLILMCGAVLSLLVFVLLRGRSAGKELTQAKTKEIHTVTFAYSDGTVIEKKQVHHGNGIFPPDFETDGVFRGWSSPFNAVTSDVETHPSVYYPTDDENLICFDSVYVREGENFTVELMLRGKVSIASAELTLFYDREVMDYLSAEVSDCFSVEQTEDGNLTLRLDSPQPIREPMLLARIRFYAKPMDVYSTQISLQAKQATTVVSGKELSATISTLNNNIYYFQEVG